MTTKQELCKWQLEQMEIYKEYTAFSVNLAGPITVSAYNYDERQDGIYITQWLCDTDHDNPDEAIAHDTMEIYLSKDDYLKLIKMTVGIKSLFQLIGEKFEEKDLSTKAQIKDLDELMQK